MSTEVTRRGGWRRWLYFVVILFPLLVLSLWYVQRSSVDVVWEDAFLHIPMIGRFLEGRGSLGDLVGPFYGQHLLFGYRVLLLLNARLLSLDMRLDPAMFVAASATMATIIYADFTSQLTALREWLAALLSAPLILLCFSLIAPPGGLMCTQFVWGTVIALVVAWLVQREFRRHRQGSPWLTTNTGCAIVLTVVYFLLLSGAYFPGFLAGIAAMALARRLCSKRRFERRYWLLAGTTLAAAAVYSWFASHSAEQSDAGGGLRLFFAHAVDTALSYVTAIGASLVDPHTLEGHSQTIWLVLGFLLLAMAIASVVVYIRLRLYEQTYLPIYCLAYPLGVVTMIRVGRASFGWAWMGNEWYLFHYRLFAIGVVWILIYAAVTVLRRGWRPVRSWRTSGALVMALLVVTAVLVGGSHLIANGKQWRRGPYVRYWLEDKRNALLFPQFYADPDAVLLTPGGDSGEARAILEKYHLSSFSARSMAALDDGLGFSVLPFEGWSGDGWMGKRAVGAVIAKSDGVAQLTAFVPEFLPGNDIEVAVDGQTVFAGNVPAGTTKTFTAPVSKGVNEIVVKCARAASPLSLGLGQDQRLLGVLLTVSAVDPVQRVR